ncbi:MAG: NADH-quinone oxidoreductase subunit N [Gammaproteobacteria bacterium]|jgi:NADH-quinone oxidoreductase subunit N|nr:NADH-quinone oxidoreductase subunit N [Gammaproteobacteria bacterium]
MSTDVLIDLLQVILLTLTTVVVMLVAGFKREHGLVNILTSAGLAASLLVFVFIDPVLPLQATELLYFDEYSLFFSGLIIFGALVVSILAYPYFESHNKLNEEFYILLMTATLGAVVLACSTHFVSFFIGMEMLGISLYAMIAYPVHADKAAKFPLEAALKYLIMSGLASGLILFGIALLYALTGTMFFSDLAPAIEAQDVASSPVLMTGWLMIIGGIAFKLSLVPFHIWTPDVYEGAPVPVTAFLATVSKAAMLAVTLRLLLVSDAFQYDALMLVLTVMAAASMMLGNFLALLQANVKRLFAYSSIAHLGYLLVVIIAAASVPGMLSVESMSFYVAAYFIMSLGGFAVISALSNSGKELDMINDYQGLFWRNPWLAAVMITVLFSLAGIPLTAGFIGKFYVFTSGVEGSLWFLLTMLIIGSAIGLYYYLRIIYAILQPIKKVSKQDPASKAIPFGTNAVLAITTIFVIYLGVYPMPMIEILQSLAASF